MSQKKKTIIADTFSKYSGSYDRYAHAQKIGAARLMDWLFQHADPLPDGPVLEIGCGTGLISTALADRLPDRDLIFSDISGGMLDACRKKIMAQGLSRPGMTFRKLDGEAVSGESLYSVIVSGFTFQWFDDLPAAISRMCRALQPGGVLAASFQAFGSFPEWRMACRELDIPYTANPLPDPDVVHSALSAHCRDVDMVEVRIPVNYASSLAFFQSLKRIGAGTHTSREQLTAVQMKKLLRYWDSRNPHGITVTYQVFFIRGVR